MTGFYLWRNDHIDNDLWSGMSVVNLGYVSSGENR